jgi:hypothetical protein
VQLSDETLITELSIAPDGRIFVFGLSREVLDLLNDINLSTDAMKQRIEYIDALEIKTMPSPPTTLPKVDGKLCSNPLEQSDSSHLTTRMQTNKARTVQNIVGISTKESEQ